MNPFRIPGLQDLYESAVEASVRITCGPFRRLDKAEQYALESIEKGLIGIRIFRSKRTPGAWIVQGWSRP